MSDAASEATPAVSEATAVATRRPIDGIDGPPPPPPKGPRGEVTISWPTDGEIVVAGPVRIYGIATGSNFPSNKVDVSVGGLPHKGRPVDDGGNWYVDTTLQFTPVPVEISATDGRQTVGDLITIYVSQPEIRTRLAPAGASSGNTAAMVAVDENGRVWYTWWELGGGAKGWLPLQDDHHTDATPAAALTGTYLFVMIKGAGEDTLYLNQGTLGKPPFVGWL